MKGFPDRGPGSPCTTKKTFLSIPSLPPYPQILDIGYGTGAATIEFAYLSGGTVIGLDIYEPFLRILETRAVDCGLQLSRKSMQTTSPEVQIFLEEIGEKITLYRQYAIWYGYGILRHEKITFFLMSQVQKVYSGNLLDLG